MNLLILNAGSSSLKFGVYAVDGGAAPRLLHRGAVEEIGRHGRFRILHTADPAAREDRDLVVRDHHAALGLVLDWLEARGPGLALVAAGHRVVHGGPRFSGPVRVDRAVLEALAELVPLSPLHQPHNLSAIHALVRLRPDLPQVACFDTAFHHTLPPVAQAFALPREMQAAGIRRYGFHGLSYQHIADVLPDHLGERADGRVVVAHLGNGASLCAMKRRRSRETTMSFTPLDGIPMGTRCGALDPGVLLYLMRERGMGLAELTDLLHHRSGLLGLSGITCDVRELQESGVAYAREALELFAYKVAQAVAALAAALEGLDALVFTAGIGEHAAPVRADICRRLGWLGLELDEAANAGHGPRISRMDSAVSAWVIATDEEGVMARQTWDLTRDGGAPVTPL